MSEQFESKIVDFYFQRFMDYIFEQEKTLEIKNKEKENKPTN